MRLVVQRVSESSVSVGDKVVGKIGNGFMVLVGITNDDNEMIVDKMIDKLINLRIFEDENEKLNLSLLDVGGSILSISQFTLYANCKKGRRPSFLDAAKPDVSKPLYDYFNQKLKDSGIKVETGIFGAMMDVSLVNSGPVTIILDSKEIFN
ncbi:D-aminoacyl-tRNA deacylase [Thomasclavelia sp.]|uniref:D-aminoacyl-tRNA deacylase n=1 Tax=Thomasclavelia sp. TaxID=3025757 RepID=UPI0025FE6888|nr:D-aminoacyl-tRNA deacylase [Thomasclavelia sp.]